MQTILLLEPPDGNMSNYLTGQYRFIVERLNIETSPFIEADRLIQNIKEKKYLIDGVLSFYDYPSIVGAILAKKLNLPGPSVQSVYYAQNKAEFLKKISSKHIYQAPWSLININSFPDKIKGKKMLFIRPIKGSFSVNAYKVKNTADLHRIHTLLVTRSRPLEEGFRLFFRHFNTSIHPEDYFILQQYIRARQYTLDGFVFNKRVHFIGIVQSVYTPDRTSFKRFDSPVKLPVQTVKQLESITKQIVHILEYDQSGFNMEFFLLPDNTIMPVEFNTRISPGFYYLYKQLYKKSIFNMMADLSIGKMPNMEKKKSKSYASSFPLRLDHDARLVSKPSPSHIVRLQKKYDAPKIHIYIDIGKRLSDYRQDAYSYRYGLIDILGRSRKEILIKFRRLMEEIQAHLTLQKT